ncbi:acyltransferase [Rhodoblastus acidophilus]|uniref:Acyltransferase n=1 Tax=Candidatus Rhodoblastus alkanivorans TaxID=2954117 RepID=A0ABS9Z3T1_9HYPH|nr:acyltransferase [Candidatus Rhodoblastus alkanivorans]MCI4677275.1 acyltransferase [Candidatus Rhodoblastus alkanivorans]MCI4682010.1 acyltransferase [Candidatus Rhodoblastus alkanivorans]MDI4643061.1 acyltransferase [Rhodoblastus acidophilus]
MILLGQARGRDNNFDLIRIAAAFVVLFVHSQALSGGGGFANLAGVRDFTIGAVAVDVFFFTSGFLVAGSLISRANIFEFAWARALRVFPGLWLMMIVTVTVLGLFVGPLPATEFFSSPITRDYLRHGATLINGVKFYLPGLFLTNPYPGVVNGSLWTLPVEWRLYEYLAAGWVVLALKPAWRIPFFRYATPAVALALAFVVTRAFFHNGARAGALVPQAMFFYGAALQMWRARIKLSYFRFGLILAALGVAALNSGAFFLVYLAALGPLTLHFAYLFGGPIRAYNRLGDYSYGLYIYAFPIQQSLVAAIPGVTAMQLNLYASALALTCAVLSWHLVERRALNWKAVPAEATERLFERLRGGFAGWRARSTA